MSGVIHLFPFCNFMACMRLAVHFYPLSQTHDAGSCMVGPVQYNTCLLPPLNIIEKQGYMFIP